MSQYLEQYKLETIQNQRLKFIWIVTAVKVREFSPILAISYWH